MRKIVHRPSLRKTNLLNRELDKTLTCLSARSSPECLLQTQHRRQNGATRRRGTQSGQQGTHETKKTHPHTQRAPGGKRNGDSANAKAGVRRTGLG